MTNFKAVYQGNIEGEYYGFTIGMEYDVEVDENNIIVTTDDNCSCRRINNGAFHKFSFIGERQSASATSAADEKEVSISYRDNNRGEMKYKMNGIDVTKSFFYDSIIEFELLKSKGVSVLIDFDVSFE